MTSTPTNKAPRKARRKVTTDLGRQLLTRERQRLAREQAALAEQQLLEAERRRDQQKRNVKSVNPIDVALSRSTVRRLAGVLASEGVNVRITAQPASQTSAWTDFSQIFLGYEAQDDERTLVATIRGLGFHEGGHCRFTLPRPQLAEQAGVSDDYNLHKAWNCLEDQRMETAVVSDSPRKAAYFTPMIMLNHTATVNHAAANWPLLIWRRYLPVSIRKGARKLFVAKHTLQGIDGEALARDFERVTTSYVLATDAVTMWAAVVEYGELLQRCLPMMANVDDHAAGHSRQYRQSDDRNLDDYLVIPVEGGMIGEGGDSNEDEGEASDTIDTPEQWERFYEAFRTLINGGDVILVIYSPQGEGESEGEGGSGAGELGEDDKPEGNPGGGDESDDEGDDEGSNGTGADDEGLEYANERRDDSGSEGEDDGSKTEQGGSTGEHKNTGVRDDLDYKPEEELTDDMLQEAIDEAVAERDSDHGLDAEVNALHDALNDRTSDLMPYTAGVSNDAEAKAAADNLAQDIEQAFQENTVDKAPGWCEGQTRGFVNVLRYETRAPGAVDFFKAYVDTDAPGQNISVSVLLDYSASMGDATKELAQAGYATKVACQALDIPCTVILWDTQATVLWDAHEYAEALPVIVATGGTDPTVALADLEKQRYDKDIHIVLVMTDGAWGGSCANTGYLANYKGDTPGRYFIGLGYSSGWENVTDISNNLRRYGCDEAHAMDSLMEIPRYLEEALIRFS